MGKIEERNSFNQHKGKSRNKSKGRMSYLKKFRSGKGGNTSEAKVDEHGQKYGDYVPAYGSRSERGGNFRGPGRRREFVKQGMKGFLCTTNFKEMECTREAYNILNEYCDDTVLEQKQESSEQASMEQGKQESCQQDTEASTAAEPKEGDEKDEEEEDIDKMLAKELTDLKSDTTVKKFQRVETGITNVVFISTTIQDPTNLAHRIFEDISTKKTSKSRHLLRLLPIELTCNANDLEELTVKGKDVIENYLKTGYNSFKIVVNVRLNSKIKKDDLIKSLAELVSQINPLNFVDLNNAKYTIVVEVLKHILCLGVVEDFAKYKKYNLLEASSSTPADTGKGEGSNSMNLNVADSAVQVPTDN